MATDAKSAEVDEATRDEWIADVDALFREIEAWSATRGWATRRDPEWIE